MLRSSKIISTFFLTNVVWVLNSLNLSLLCPAQGCRAKISLHSRPHYFYGTWQNCYPLFLILGVSRQTSDPPNPSDDFGGWTRFSTLLTWHPACRLSIFQFKTSETRPKLKSIQYLAIFFRFRPFFQISVIFFQIPIIFFQISASFF